MKMPTAIPACLVTLGLASALLPGPALVTPVEDAQAYVIDQTPQGHNVLAMGCSALQSENGKNICS